MQTTIRCKMCGAVLNVETDGTVIKCDYCGTAQTIPSFSNERKRSYFQRANDLRLQCEFDKASALYEILVSEFPEESEAYWGLLICKFGIEYVEEHGKWIPTCHRLQTKSILDDPDYRKALEYSDVIARSVYEQEAKRIDLIARRLLQLSYSEEPFDIFICYKETDAQGSRTEDSVLAFDIYAALKKAGYRVFFAKVTLEGKLGTEYEPYIYSALSSAKVMLHVTTSTENTNSVWVKNEWKRFLENMDSGKVFIPCYRYILPEELPDEMKHFQGQDLGKIGAIQDLMCGINKILPQPQQRMPGGVADEYNVLSPATDRLREEYNENVAALKDIDSYYSVASDLDSCIRYFERCVDYRDCGYYLKQAKLKYVQKVHSYEECVRALSYLDELNGLSDTEALRREIEKKKRKYREEQLIREGFAVNIVEGEALYLLLPSLHDLLAAYRKLKEHEELSEDDRQIAFQALERSARYIDGHIMKAITAENDIDRLLTLSETLQKATKDVRLSNCTEVVAAANRKAEELAAVSLKTKRKRRIKLTVVWVAVILAATLAILAMFYFWMRKEAGYSWEHYDYYVVQKFNDRYNEELAQGYNQAGYFYDLEVRIENHSPNDVSYLEGDLDIEYSVTGELLGSFHVQLRGALEAETDAVWVLELHLDTSDEARKLWASDLSDLNCYFQVEKIYFSDETVKEFDDAERQIMQYKAD